MNGAIFGERERESSRQLLVRPILPRHPRALAGLLLLAVAAVPVLPAPAQAAILVSNLGQGAATGTMNASWDPEVQGFQTGTHQVGYSLTSVQLHIDSFVAPATIAGMTIKLRPGSEYNPDALTFSNPTFTSAGTVTFTLPTGTTYDLTPETRYYVVWSATRKLSRHGGDCSGKIGLKGGGGFCHEKDA